MPARPALRPGFLFLLATSLCPQVFSAVPPDLESPEFQLDVTALEPVWRDRFEALRVDEPVAATFLESRKNSFRKGARTFSGTIRVDPQRGVSLHYAEPLDVILVGAIGTLWRRPSSGEWTAYPAPDDGSIGDWTAGLWQFDFPALAKEFAFYGRPLEGQAWELFLTPRENFRLPEIHLRAEDSRLTRIDLELSPTREITYDLKEFDPSPEVGDWDRYFPPTPKP